MLARRAIILDGCLATGFILRLVTGNLIVVAGGLVVVARGLIVLVVAGVVVIRRVVESRIHDIGVAVSEESRIAEEIPVLKCVCPSAKAIVISVVVTIVIPVATAAPVVIPMAIPIVVPCTIAAWEAWLEARPGSH